MAIAAVEPFIVARVRAEADGQLDKALAERDEAHEWADRLAATLGGAGIGEHSSANNPWDRALELANERDAAIRAEAVAEERQRIARDIEDEFRQRIQARVDQNRADGYPQTADAMLAGAGYLLDVLREWAAGSVPVATPEASSVGTGTPAEAVDQAEHRRELVELLTGRYPYPAEEVSGGSGPVRCWCHGDPTVSHRQGAEGCRFAAGGDLEANAVWPLGQLAVIVWHSWAGGSNPPMVAEWTGQRWKPANSGGYGRLISPSQVAAVHPLVRMPSRLAAALGDGE